MEFIAAVAVGFLVCLVLRMLIGGNQNFRVACDIAMIVVGCFTVNPIVIGLGIWLLVRDKKGNVRGN